MKEKLDGKIAEFYILSDRQYAEKNGAQQCAPLFFIIVGGVRQNFRTHKTKWTKELYSAEGGVPQNFKTHKTRAAKKRFRKKL